jgi:hypothetical protein
VGGERIGVMSKNDKEVDLYHARRGTELRSHRKFFKTVYFKIANNVKWFK